MRLNAPLLPAWFRWTAVIGLAGFIFYASIITVPPETPVDAWKPTLLPLDKWRHFVAYAVLGGALAYAITDWEYSTLTQALIVFIIIVIYGVGIEFGQTLTPDRYFSVGDAYANALGAVLVMPWYILRPYFRFLPVTDWLKIAPTGILDTD
jgi:VanZ family protein